MKFTLMQITLISFLLLLLIPDHTSAELKTFIKEYTYQASEFDSKASSRTIALEQVKRLLLEELGTFLETSTEVKDFQLTKDQIKAFSAGIVQTEILKEKWDGERFWIKAKIKADPDEVTKRIDSLRNDKDKTGEYEDANKKADSALREVEKLKKELELVKRDRTQIARYDQAIQNLDATEWYRKGLAAMRIGNNNEAVSAYTRAIQLDPTYVRVYIDRSFVYSRLGNYQQVFNDANKAIELDPGNAQAYLNRGQAYSNFGNHQQAFNDANKAIELDPGNVIAYINRGVEFSRLGNAQRAIDDYNKAIGLNPRYALAYVNRSGAFIKLGNYQQAIKDANMAIELDPKNGMAYNNRGTAYAKLGQKKNADNDYKTARSLGFNFSERKVKKRSSWF